MALPGTQQHREYQNFKDNGDGTTSRYVWMVNGGGGGSSGGLLDGVVYDFISAAYPNATTEVFTFKNGGLSGATTATVTVVYTDSTKENISTVEKT